MQINTDLLATNHAENVSITIGDEEIKGNKSVKLLGVTIDNKLHFDEHVSNICKKVSCKLHALARISNFIDKDKVPPDYESVHRISV